jgi:hypothetical protein
MAKRAKVSGNKRKGLVTVYIIARGREYVSGFSYPPHSDRKVILVQTNRKLSERDPGDTEGGFFNPADGTLYQEQAPIAMSEKQLKIGADCFPMFHKERRLAYEWWGDTGERSAEWISSLILESFVIEGPSYRDMMAMTGV